MPYRRKKLITVSLQDIKPYDVIYIKGKRYGVSMITYTPNAHINRTELAGGPYITDLVTLEVRPWLQWKGYLKTHEMVALCAGFCDHGGMHIVTKADRDHTTVRPPKKLKIDMAKYDAHPWIKKQEVR